MYYVTLFRIRWAKRVPPDLLSQHLNQTLRAIGTGKKISQNKKILKNVQSIPKTVWLLERPEEDVSCNRENSFTEDSVLVRAEIDLTSDQNKEEIRGELQTVFKNEILTLICMILSL